MSRKKTWNASKHFLTPLQTARLLNTCEETIYRLLARKEMSGLKVGRAWRIPVSQFRTGHDGTGATGQHHVRE